MDNNPLIDLKGLPPFSKIQPSHVVVAIDGLLEEGRQWVATRLADSEPASWSNLVAPLARLEEHLNKTWSPVSHMNAVVNNDALREVYNICLPKLSEYGTEMGQNSALFKAYQSVLEKEEGLNPVQAKVLENILRDFRLSGVDLPTDKKHRYKEVAQRLSTLTSKVAENVLDATNDWHKLITDENLLKGLPDSAIALAKQTADQRHKKGWMLTLDFPSYLPVMTYADSQPLRREVYEAFSTRASECGPGAGRWDNTPLLDEILSLRHEKARLLGFNNYAELSLATKMASSCDVVVDFLGDLARHSHHQAGQELDELKAFSKSECGVDKLEAWDISYYAEKLRLHRYDISQETLKPYFPETKVVPGLFEVVKRLYGLIINEVTEVDTWHPDVRFFEILDSQGSLRGQFYLDLYARPNKRGGAWMDDCMTRVNADGYQQSPVAYLVCNFSPPIDGKPALFTHSEVETLFHEFGHGLHHLLTKVDYSEVAGINGVAWDAVELPSQLMENWCWEHSALALFSGHFETGEPLPDELFERMTAAKNFQSAMQMVRQLEFALFDFRIHREYQPSSGARIYKILDEVRQQVAVLHPPAFNRFAHAFTHIFAGGYAAGYYSYKWAEVLSADAYSLFEKNGVFDQKTGQLFLQEVLEKGGSEDAMDLFVAFRGREPNVDALLRHSSINGR